MLHLYDWSESSINELYNFGTLAAGEEHSRETTQSSIDAQSIYKNQKLPENAQDPLSVTRSSKTASASKLETLPPSGDF